MEEINTSITNNQLNYSIQMNRNEHKLHKVENAKIMNSDFTCSTGVDDKCRLNDKIDFTARLPYNYLKSLEADDQVTAADTTNFPKNNHHAANAQIAMSSMPNHKLSVSAFVAQKTRFTTLRERHSYKMEQELFKLNFQSVKAAHSYISFQNNLLRNLPIDGSIHHIRLNDVIKSECGVQGNLIQLQNAGKSRFNGADLSLHFALLYNLDLTASYSFIIQKKNSNPSCGIVANEFHLFNLQGSASRKQFALFAGIKNLFDANYAYA